MNRCRLASRKLRILPKRSRFVRTANFLSGQNIDSISVQVSYSRNNYDGVADSFLVEIELNEGSISNEDQPGL